MDKGKLILVVGPESSGTKMLATILTKCGLNIQYRSMPHGRDWAFPHRFRAKEVVVIIRNGQITKKSMLDGGRSTTWTVGRNMRQAIHYLAHKPRMLGGTYGDNWHLITYESIIYEREDAIKLLLESLGITVKKETLFEACKDIRNANMKWYGYTNKFRDQRSVEDRLNNKHIDVVEW